MRKLVVSFLSFSCLMLMPSVGGAQHDQTCQLPNETCSVIISVDSKKVEWSKVSIDGFPDGLWRRPLHANESNKSGASILKFEKGVVEPKHFHTSAGHSVFILKGALNVAGEIMTAGQFIYTPKGVVHGPNIALEETEILLWSDGPLDLHFVPKTGDKSE